MNIHQDFRNRLKSTFAPLSRTASGSFPQIGHLSKELTDALDGSAGTTAGVPVSREIVKAFATASVDIWLRAVQSFLVSCALTEASPVWASVTGYYASHYAIRALAHALGYFQLFHRKKIVRLQFSNGRYQCTMESKTARDREHKYYWDVVKEDPQFASDPFFRRNVLIDDMSESGHRERANYADHVAELPTFRVIDRDTLCNRITQISQIQFEAPPVPRLGQFPDVESVQIIAYHRLVRFRQLLDEGVGVKNRFWGVHRQPSWADRLIDFQLTEQGGLTSAATRL
jgi:hypothetical protein